MNMIKLFFAIIITSICLSANAQFERSEIKFERKLYYLKMYASLPWISEEQRTKQMLVWGKNDGRVQNYKLQVDHNQSLYTYGETENEYSWSRKEDEFLLIHNLLQNKVEHQRVVAGKLMVLEGDAPETKWKIHNEIRQVAGYLCMKAVTQDTIKDQEITAWFTTEIPISTGPEGLGGLPGLILMVEVNDGTMVLEATEIKPMTDEIERPKKMKGKKMSFEEYNEFLKKYFKQSIERERNPYWGLRY